MDNKIYQISIGCRYIGTQDMISIIRDYRKGGKELSIYGFVRGYMIINYVDLNINNNSGITFRKGPSPSRKGSTEICIIISPC